MGFNVQAAVGALNHQIVAHEVTNVGNDRAQLRTMAMASCSTPRWRTSWSLNTLATTS